jgi:Ca2+-binding EF-hand superfamily protein
MQTGKLDEEQKAELQQAFDLFDKDKSGSITINELSDVMNSLGFNPTKQQLTDMVTK